MQSTGALITRFAWASLILITVPCSSSEAQGTADRSSEKEPIVFISPPGLTTPEYLRFDLPMQSGNRCGPNGIFMLLRICGVDCSYQEIVDAISLEEKGANIAQLCEVTQKHGISCEVRKNLSPEDVANAPKPLILHLSAERARKSSLPQDHFALITHMAENHDYIGIDTTNGTNARFHPQAIARSMTGNALIVTDLNSSLSGNGDWRLTSFGCWSIVALLVATNCVVFFKSRSS